MPGTWSPRSRARAEGLDEIPRKGRKVPELNEDAVREVSVFSWRIICEIRSEAVPARIEVLAVVHKRRDMRADEITRD